MTPKTTQPHGQGGAAATGANAGGGYSPIISLNRPNSQASNYLLAHALRYALAGWRVLPLQPGGKAPLTAHGVKDASSDPEQIGAWWQQWPAANIGLALGDDVVCFDVDPRNGGTIDALARLGLDHGATVTQRTAGGGWHVIYQKPHGWPLAGKVANVPGVDVLSGDKYIVAAPSVIDGKRYTWERDPLDVDPARIPLDLAERLTKRSPAARTDAHNGPTAAQPAPRGNVPPFHVLEHALAHLDPWSFGYDTWLACLMALHSAYPGADGLALAEAWADGQPGEVAGKWATFDAAGGVTVGTLLHHAKAAGWRPELAQDEAPTRDTAHSILHAKLKPTGERCPVCGQSFFERANVGDEVRGRRRIKACHRRGCETWQAWRIKDKIAARQPWTWPAWFVVEVEDGAPWRALVNGGPLGRRDDWLGTPTVKGTVALFSGFALPGAVSVSMRTMLEMAAERMVAIPGGTPGKRGTGKRLRAPKDAARAKRTAQPVAVVEDAQPAQPVIWTKHAFGLDLLSERETWEVLAILEYNGATVDRRGNFSYPVALDDTMRAAVARWIRPERDELDLDAIQPTAEGSASKSGFVPLPEQPAWPDMPETQRRLARLRLHGDTNHASIAREVHRM